MNTEMKSYINKGWKDWPEAKGAAASVETPTPYLHQPAVSTWMKVSLPWDAHCFRRSLYALVFFLLRDRPSLSTEGFSDIGQGYCIKGVDVRIWLALLNLPHMPDSEWQSDLIDPEARKLAQDLLDVGLMLGKNELSGDAETAKDELAFFSNQDGELTALLSIGKRLLERSQQDPSSLPFPLLVTAEPSESYEALRNTLNNEDADALKERLIVMPYESEAAP